MSEPMRYSTWCEHCRDQLTLDQLQQVALALQTEDQEA